MQCSTAELIALTKATKRVTFRKERHYAISLGRFGLRTARARLPLPPQQSQAIAQCAAEGRAEDDEPGGDGGA